MRARSSLLAGLSFLGAYSLLLMVTYRGLGGWLATFVLAAAAIAVVLRAPGRSHLAVALLFAAEAIVRAVFAIEGRGLDYLTLLNGSLALAFAAAALGTWQRARWTWSALAAATLVSAAFVAHEVIVGRWLAVVHYTLHTSALALLALSARRER